METKELNLLLLELITLFRKNLGLRARNLPFGMSNSRKRQTIHAKVKIEGVIAGRVSCVIGFI